MKRAVLPKVGLIEKTVFSKVSRTVLGGNLSISPDSASKEVVFTRVRFTKKRFFFVFDRTAAGLRSQVLSFISPIRCVHY